jgi:hypothetical protein
MNRRWLQSNPAGPHESSMLKLSRDWEPSDSSGASQSSEDEKTPLLVSY